MRGSNQEVVLVWWLIKYISPSGVAACSQPSGRGPSASDDVLLTVPVTTNDKSSSSSSIQLDQSSEAIDKRTNTPVAPIARDFISVRPVVT